MVSPIGQKLNSKVAQNFRTEPEVKAEKDKDLMGHKSNDVGEDEEGDKSIPLLPLRVQYKNTEYNIKRGPTNTKNISKNRAYSKDQDKDINRYTIKRRQRQGCRTTRASWWSAPRGRGRRAQ